MALIKCSECGKEISDKSTECIHCGNPISKKEHKEIRSWYDLSDEEQEALEEEFEEKYNKVPQSKLLTVILGFIVGFMLMFTLYPILNEEVFDFAMDDFLEGFGWVLLSGIIGMFVGGFIVDAQEKKYNNEFSKWLASSKNIKL